MSESGFVVLLLVGIVVVLLVASLLGLSLRKRRLVSSARKLADELGLQVAHVNGINAPRVLLNGSLEGQEIEVTICDKCMIRVRLADSPILQTLHLGAYDVAVRTKLMHDGERWAATGDGVFDSKYVVWDGDNAVSSVSPAVREILLEHHHPSIHIESGTLTLFEHGKISDYALTIQRAAELAKLLRAASA